MKQNCYCLNMNLVLMWFKSRKIELLIFAILFLAGAAFNHPVEYDNTKSRYALLSAVVDYGTLNIDANSGTLDKSEWNGHYYSNKAPGAPLLGIPVYWFLRHLTPLRVSEPMGPLEMYIVRVMTTTLLFALLGVVMYRLAQFCGATSRRAFLMVVAYGFGSIALLHSTLFSGHQIAASLSFFSLALLVHLSGNDQKAEGGHWGYGFLAGLLAGLAVLTDYTAIVIALGLTVYAITSRMGTRLKLGFLAGGCVCVLFLALYNMACFGHPFSSSYEHQAIDKFREGAAHGILGVGLPHIGAMLGLIFSPSRGVFFIMPVLLLSLWGIAHMIGRKQHVREMVLIVAVATGSLLFIAGFYGWHGGWAFGPRYLVPMLPFLAFPIAFSPWRPYLFWLLFVPSCAQVSFSVIGVPHVPESIANPIVEFIVPCMSYGYTAQNAGMLLRLTWPWSVMTVVVIVGLIGVWAFRESNRENLPRGEDRISALSAAILVVWIGTILVMLAMVRTDSLTMVTRYKSQVLRDASFFYNNRGNVYDKRGQHQRAIEDYNKTIRLKPDYADAYYNRGIVYLILGQHQRAIEDFNQTIRLQEDCADAYNNRAIVHLIQGNKKLGCYDAQKACALGVCKALEQAKQRGECR
jgi:hypothetical protein